jgi:uncharacterized membrane protein YcaP (DUF421 family)
MKKSAIQIDDIYRIVFGEAPVVFAVEVALRTVIIYIFLLLVVKWFGKRMSGQLTILELGIMIMLGAIVSPVTSSPERGIAEGMLCLVLILLFQRGITLLGIKNKKLEKLTENVLGICVIDGIVQVKELQRVGVPSSQLFTILRQKNIYNLGKVKRVYIEACGIFSIFESKDAKPGLSLLPVEDTEIHSIQQNAADELMSCTNCGNTKKISNSDETCTHCGGKHWKKATL